MGANINLTGKGIKHGENLVQRTRAAVLNTFDAVEKRGKKISEILADEFVKNPIKFMELAAKVIPKEINGNFNHSHEIERLSNDEVIGQIEEIRNLLGVLQTEAKPTGAGVKEKGSSEQVH